MRFFVVYQFIKFITAAWSSVNLLHRLEGSLNHVEQNLDTITPDLVLGISFAEGQLRDIESGLIGTKSKFLLQKVIKQCSAIRNEFNKTSYDTIWGSSGIFDPNLWKSGDEFKIKYNRLNVLKTNPFGSIQNYLEVADTGHPSELESDNCILEMLHTNCNNDKRTCEEIMDVTSPSYGYHLTHKLLFYIIFNQLNCSKSNNLVHQKIVHICLKIFDEVNFIEDQDFPSELQDLFMEQVLLCGFIGFAEYLQPDYADQILSWQKPSGCFAESSPNSECRNHMTGIGITLISIYTKISLLKVQSFL